MNLLNDREKGVKLFKTLELKKKNTEKTFLENENSKLFCFQIFADVQNLTGQIKTAKAILKRQLTLLQNSSSLFATPTGRIRPSRLCAGNGMTCSGIWQ